MAVRVAELIGAGCLFTIACVCSFAVFGLGILPEKMYLPPLIGFYFYVLCGLC